MVASAAAMGREERAWESVMAGELHEVSKAIGALQEQVRGLAEKQNSFLTLLHEKDERDQLAHADTKRKVDILYKAYTMGGGIFWFMTLGGVGLALVELFAKARVLFHW